MNTKYCNNCGNYGHTYNKCRHPILSYGVILYKIDKKLNIPKIVMVERKDSLSFIEFIRGKYKSYDNTKYIQLLISRMTAEEKNKLLNNSFENLWNLLWIHLDNVNPKIKKEYDKSKINFDMLKKGFLKDDIFFNLKKLIDLVKDNYEENEWEIPKGRRSNHENNKDCALREFNEETNIESHNYSIINNIIPMIEEYKGINNVRYKHIYYIAMTEKEIELKIDMKNKNQYTEVKNIAWLSKKECYEKIRNYDKNKKKIIHDFFELYENIYTQKKIQIKIKS
jgi:ADP-ribose pyrophosphatase YjhB (NUDIX family)